MKNSIFTFAIMVVLMAMPAFAQQESDSYVVQGYQFASASTGKLSSPTMQFQGDIGRLEKVSDLSCSVLKLELGEYVSFYFSLPKTATKVRLRISYYSSEKTMKGRIRLNNQLVPENSVLIENGNNSGFTMREYSLENFQSENELRIFPVNDVLHFLNITILYEYTMPSCTVGDVTVKLLSPDSDKNSWTPDLTFTWAGNDSCDKGWITLKYKEGEEWKTVPGAESFDYGDEEWKDKTNGQFVWKKHGLKAFPELKIVYSPDESPKHEKARLAAEAKATADQIANEAKNHLQNKQYDEALKKIEEALKSYPSDEDYNQLKQRIDNAKAEQKENERKEQANQIAKEAEKSFNEKKYDEALAKIDEALKMYPSNDDYKQIKQRIRNTKLEQEGRERADQIANEALSLLQNKKIYDALDKIEEALKIKPYDYNYYQLKQRIIAAKDPSLIEGRKAGEQVDKEINGVKFVFHWCPADSFTMGDTSEKSLAHSVTLTKGYWMMETEVTQRQWKAIMGKNPSKFIGEDLPVECVTWEDCQDFCKECSKLGLPMVLPTEAQWEYACRAGNTSPYAGNLYEMAWYKDNSGGQTHPVGKTKPNSWGLYDMHGNVSEWCEDWMSKYPNGKVSDPHGPIQGFFRIIRGGCWLDDLSLCTASFRDGNSTYTAFKGLGFRCVVNPK